MKLKKIFPYNIKKALPVLGLAGASFFMGGCDKNDEPTVPTMDLVVEINQSTPELLFYDDENKVRHPSKMIQEYVADPKVRTIYLMPTENWNNYSAKAITGMRKLTLEMLLNYSDKIKGRGDFNFTLGEASKVPQDSLWYVKNGWTINFFRIYYRSKSKDLTR